MIKGDAAGEIAAPLDGRWTEAIREAYADRVEAILASHIEGFRENVVARRAFSPADLEAMNVNLVGGDPYGGSCTIDQSFIWRPFVEHPEPRNIDPRALSNRRLDASRRRAFRRLGIRAGGASRMNRAGADSKSRGYGRAAERVRGASPLSAKSASTTSRPIF